MTREEITWLSTRDAAGMLGITTRTLYRLIDSGQIPAYKFGRVIRLQESEVEAFIQSARIEPGALEHLYADTTTPDADADPPDLDTDLGTDLDTDLGADLVAGDDLDSR